MEKERQKEEVFVEKTEAILSIKNSLNAVRNRLRSEKERGSKED